MKDYKGTIVLTLDHFVPYLQSFFITFRSNYLKNVKAVTFHTLFLFFLRRSYTNLKRYLLPKKGSPNLH